MEILICITELNYISKYINYALYIYIYIYIITSETEKSEISSHALNAEWELLWLFSL